MDKIATFRAFLASKPTDRFARYALALELKRTGDLAGAESELRTLLSTHPSSGAGWLQLGNVLVEQERPADAAVAWNDGITALTGLSDADSRRSYAEITAALATLPDAE